MTSKSVYSFQLLQKFEVREPTIIVQIETSNEWLLSSRGTRDLWTHLLETSVSKDGYTMLHRIVVVKECDATEVQ
jgi:hypothetical protein